MAWSEYVFKYFGSDNHMWVISKEKNVVLF